MVGMILLLMRMAADMLRMIRLNEEQLLFYNKKQCYEQFAGSKSNE
tara:strand:+ start:251 stop:388 length:138 start_codon:yes stop_codon:yes gene_type:complete